MLRFAVATGARARLLTALTLIAGVSFVAMTPASAAASPTIASQASTPTNVGFEIFDTAHVVGGSAVTGSLTFNLFGPADATCAGTHIFTSTKPVSGGTTVESAHFTTAQAGTYRWEVSYSGDANNNPSGPTPCSDPNESVDVAPFATVSLSTVASPGVAVGAGSLHDTATLTGFNPTGTITFHLSGPSDTFCAGPSVFTATVPVLSGNGNYPSGDFTPTVAGVYRWQASYSGDANNVSIPITACLDPAETVTVTPGTASPTLATTASASVPAGGSVHDTAMLSGGANPRGTITFDLFGPGDATCANLPVFTAVTPVSGNGAYPSDPFVVGTAGSYRWTAAYSGDGANNAVTSPCGAPNEDVVVTKATPTIVTNASGPVTLGSPISDTATLAGGFTPGGTITFDLFGPDDATCTGAMVFSSTVSVSGAGRYNSGPFTPTAAGTYRFVVTYSGDTNDNQAGPTGCSDPLEAVV
ncbi:MAG: hypothetical protein QOK39_1068, partial [Acidimicrobiaceae bacterium]|nr:hypothetical protein [Acidimicrobiaceae bacterium]